MILSTFHEKLRIHRTVKSFQTVKMPGSALRFLQDPPCEMGGAVARISFMSTAAKQTRSERLVARISPRDKETIERAAEMEGRSLAAFTVEHLVAKARQVIKERTVIRLSEEESRPSPSKPNRR
jgi:uncharacterized protein (DUF1778 family)